MKFYRYILFFIILYVVALLCLRCKKEIVEYVDERPVEIYDISGKCQDEVTFHWKEVMGASTYRVYRQCSNCTREMLMRGTCSPNLDFVVETRGTHYHQKTGLDGHCRSYIFAVKAIKGSHESDFSNMVRCNIDRLNPDLPPPVVRPPTNSIFPGRIPEEFRTYDQFDGMLYTTDQVLNRGAKWDCSDGATWYETQIVYINDPSHETVVSTHNSTECSVRFDFPYSPLGLYKVQVRACNDSGCSDYADSTDPTYAVVCDIDDTNCRARAWIVYIKLAAPVIEI